MFSHLGAQTIAEMTEIPHEKGFNFEVSLTITKAVVAYRRVMFSGLPTGCF